MAETRAQYVARRRREYEGLRRQAEAAEAARADRLPEADEVRKRLAGEGGALAGLLAGIPVGAFHLGRDALSAASFAGRLMDPDDAASSPPGQAAWDDVFRGTKHILKHLEVGNGVYLPPKPIPLAPTAGEQFWRDYQTGLKAGEGVFNVGAAVAGAAELRSIPELKALSAGPEAAGYLPPGAPQRLVDAMAEDYEGMGSHAPIRQATKLPWGGRLPQWLLDSPFNRVLPPEGTPKGAFYRYHYAIDPSYHGGPVKQAFGGGGWSGRKLGWKKYGPAARAWYGTPGQTKLAGYGLLAGVGAGLDQLPSARRPK